MRRLTLPVLVLPVLAVPALLALLVGCGPSQVGAAAIVDNQTLSLDEVQARVQTALRDPQAAAQVKAANQLGALTSNVVTEGVLHLLLAETARTEHLVVTDDQVNQVIGSLGGPEAAAANTIYDARTVATRVRDQLLAIELARKYFDHLVVHADVAAVPSRAQADDLARTIAEHPEATAQILSGSPSVSGSQPGARLRAGDDPGTATTALFGVPAGNVAVFQPETAQAVWFVVYVTSRVTDAPTPTAGETGVQLASGVDQQTLAAVGIRLLEPLAMRLGVRVNPRYGVWDPIQLRVVPPDQTGGEVIPVRASAG